MENTKIVITVAVTGAFGDKSRHPALPVTPEEIAASAVEAYSAGASVAHIHVRDPETAEPSMAFKLYQEVVARIRGASDMVINLTTGAGARIVPDDSNPVGFGPGTTWSSPERRTYHRCALTMLALKKRHRDVMQSPFRQPFLCPRPEPRNTLLL